MKDVHETGKKQLKFKKNFPVNEVFVKMILSSTLKKICLEFVRSRIHAVLATEIRHVYFQINELQFQEPKMWDRREKIYDCEKFLIVLHGIK